MAKRSISHQQLISRKEILDSAKATLKNEFVGIDIVIDEMIDTVSSWYLFPDLQTKPVIINLWGLTGVGKSSLIKRLTELFYFDQKYYHFDLGDTTNQEWGIRNQLENIYKSVNGFPIIMAFDEFQHSRTIDERGKEIDKKATRIVWELLDSGKFQMSRFSYQMEEIYDVASTLKYLLRKGVRVKNGKVVARKEYFLKEMSLVSEYRKRHFGVKTCEKINVKFITDTFLGSVFSVCKERFTTEAELRIHLDSLNGDEVVDFLLQIFEFGLSPKTVDCSKSLIFVLGNLDEAYTMSSDFNPDLSADEFHEQSLKISVSQIKKVLKLRFRNEQIARLGNTHIIYPAFSSESFKKIIRLELERIIQRVKTLQNINLSFDESICEMIYKEGVYPTQGTRPVFTTIHHIVNTKLGKVVSEMVLRKLNPSSIVFRAEEEKVVIEYFNKTKQLFSFSEKQNLSLNELRKTRKDDLQAITAVHECGHVVIAMIILKTIPEFIYSVTADSEFHGFVQINLKLKYISKSMIENCLAMWLGGYVAEKLIFGVENFTAGAESDIEEATTFLTGMLRESGMGYLPATFKNKSPFADRYIQDENHILNDEAKKYIQHAVTLAEKILSEQKILLLKMADYLSDNGMMTKGKSREMLEKYARSFSVNDLIEDADHLFYRKHLKDAVDRISQSEISLVAPPINLGFLLNKVADNYTEKN